MYAKLPRVLRSKSYSSNIVDLTSMFIDDFITSIVGLNPTLSLSRERTKDKENLNP